MEAMEAMKIHLNIQIFATDIDAEALDFARAGIYPDSIAADVSEKRLKRYFTKNEGTYVVKKQVREVVVFAVQNLIKDPPFSRLDLVSCRNVLIYMDAVLQKKILPLFHYTLRNGAYLLLGTSESIGEFADYFTPISTKWKVFKRKVATQARPLETHTLPFHETAPDLSRMEGKQGLADVNIRTLPEGLILQNYAPACVLVNDKFDIVYFQGDTDMFLSPPSGEPTFNVLKMAREELRYKLSTLIHKAAKQKKTASSEGLQISHQGKTKIIDLVVRPLPEHMSPPGMLMVIFEDKVPPEISEEKGKKKKTGAPAEANPQIAALEQELQSTKEYLQTTIEELETSNEELKSTNEELQSTNEELQSTNEEMETSRKSSSPPTKSLRPSTRSSRAR